MIGLKCGSTFHYINADVGLYFIRQEMSPKSYLMAFSAISEEYHKTQCPQRPGKMLQILSWTSLTMFLLGPGGSNIYFNYQTCNNLRDILNLLHVVVSGE